MLDDVASAHGLIQPRLTVMDAEAPDVPSAANVAKSSSPRSRSISAPGPVDLARAIGVAPAQVPPLIARANAEKPIVMTSKSYALKGP
jgi:hypothetical protein